MSPCGRSGQAVAQAVTAFSSTRVLWLLHEEPDYRWPNAPSAAPKWRRFMGLCGHLKADQGFVYVTETMVWVNGIKYSRDLYKMWWCTQKYSKAMRVGQSSNNLSAQQGFTRNANIPSMASHAKYSRLWNYNLFSHRNLAVHFLCLFLTTGM